MIIIGAGFHPEFQQIAFADTDSELGHAVIVAYARNVRLIGESAER